MNKNSVKVWGWIAGVSIVVTAIVAIRVIIWPQVCPVPEQLLGEEFVKRGAQALCLEFWTNRYQALISGIASLAVAILAALLLFRQTAEQTRQAAAGRYVFATERIAELRRVQTAALSIITIADGGLRPGRDIRLSAVGFEHGLMSLIEISRAELLDLVETGRFAVQRLSQLADGHSLPPDTDRTTRVLCVSMNAFLDQCLTDAFPLRNLGMGLLSHSIPEPLTVKRSPESHQFHQQVGEQFRELDSVADTEADEWISVRDHARVAAKYAAT